MNQLQWSQPRTTPTPTPTPPPATDPERSLKMSSLTWDPGNIVPRLVLRRPLNIFTDNKTRIKNQDSLEVIDFSQHSSKERFYIINMASGRVETYQVAPW